jgi:L-alanine-DL-glutamate epimerase-like enolase superfamily enzyme
MTITAGDAYVLALPFRFEFSHARATRARGASVVVRLADDRGRVGWGEGAPRAYVTGEDVDDARRFLATDLVPRVVGTEAATLEDAAELFASLRDSFDGHNAAFCALELALLDLAGRAEGRSAGELLGPVTQDEVRYGAVLSAGSTEKAVATAARAREAGFRDFKAKVGDDAAGDLALLREVRDVIGPEASLRIDANGAWSSREEALERLTAMAELGVAAAEEPLEPHDLDGLAWLTSRSPVPIVADESLASLADARRLAERRACHVFNVRVSKLGGMLAAAQAVDIARDAGLAWMLGAHVGESALLSAAGRHVATRRPGGRWFEGSYGALLLEEDVADFTAADGRGASVTAPGLGVEVDEDALMRHAAAATEVSS